jgi:hypothetical protein
MMKRALAAFAVVAIVSGIASVLLSSGPAIASSPSSYEPRLNPADFVRVIDNLYFPLPVGRTLTYEGVKDGMTQTERVTVTNRIRVLEGITARMVTDVATHQGRLLEKTSDWYAQDRQGNVWYLGEDTTAYGPHGEQDHSGSWLAGVQDAEPGIVMEAHPRIPDAYRQEYLPGQAEDTAWVVGRGGSLTVPYGTVRNVLMTLEATRLEPGVVDEKIYAPGIGIVSERALSGPTEFAKLVRISG